MLNENTATFIPPLVDVCEDELADYTSRLAKLEVTPENAKLRELLADAVAAGRRLMETHGCIRRISERTRHSYVEFDALQEQLREAAEHRPRRGTAAGERMLQLGAAMLQAIADVGAAEAQYKQRGLAFRALTDQIPPGFQSPFRTGGVFAPLRNDWNLVVGYRATPRSPPGTDLPETGFLRQVYYALYPRVRILLEEMEGMVNVAVNVLAVTVDPDIGTLSISGRRGQSDQTMVIEVVRAFPIVDARPTLPTSSRDDDVLVPGFLKVLEFQGKWFDLEALRESLNRTAFRMETSRPPTKIGALVSKQAVFVLFRNERRVAVSDPIEYTGTDPHPAAALANAFNVAVEDPNAEDYSDIWGLLSRSRA